MELGIDGSDELAKVRCPSYRLIRSRHEECMVMNCLEERHFDSVSSVIDTEAAVAEPAWTVHRGIDKWSHHPRGALSRHTAFYRHEIKHPDTFGHTWISLGFGREDRVPIGRVGDVFEKIDWRKSQAYDPVGSIPCDSPYSRGVQCSATPNAVQIASDPHDVGQLSTQHDIERRCAAKGVVGSFDPTIGPVRLGEYNPQRLVNTHQV